MSHSHSHNPMVEPPSVFSPRAEAVDMREEDQPLAPASFDAAALEDGGQDVDSRNQTAAAAVPAPPVDQEDGDKKDIHDESPGLTDKDQQATMFSAILNLASTSVGAGTLSLPWSFAQCGAALGTFLVFFSATATAYAIHILMCLVEKTGVRTYEGLAVHAFGPLGKWAIAITVMLFLFGADCVYILVTATFMSPFKQLLVEETSFPDGIWGDRLIQFLFWLVFMLPLSLLRNVNSLRFLSMGALITVMALPISMIIYASEEHTKDEALSHITAKVPGGFVGFLLVLNNLKFAYSGQTTSFGIYKEMKDRTVTKMTIAVLVASFGTGILYAFIGITGVAAFGLDATDNALANYKELHGVEVPLQRWYVMMVYVGMAWTIVVSFPIILAPQREAVCQLLGYKDSYSTPEKIRILVSVGIATSALVLGMFIPNLTVAFGVIAGIMGNLVAYVFPAALALKIGFTVEEFGMPRVIALYALFARALLGPIGTAFALYYQFRPKN